MRPLKAIVLSSVIVAAVLPYISCAQAAPADQQYFPTLREPAPLDDFTLYRPASQPPVGHKWPVLVWGNGGCRDTNEEHQTLLEQIAAHGFFVIAVGPYDKRYMVDAPLTRGADKQKTAFDWLTARPSKRDDLRRTIDTSKIGVMGQSCGGIQALVAAADPRVKSVASWNGATGRNPRMEEINAFHTPIMWVTGGPTDNSFNGARSDFAAVPATVPAVLVENPSAGHIGVSHGTNDPAAVKAGAAPLDQILEVQGSNLAIAWLDYTLNGNSEAGKYFLGQNCTLCGVGTWTIQSKNIN